MTKTIFMPEYYDDFKCLGGDCSYTCCQSWNIALTKSDYTKMRNARKPKALQELVTKGTRRDKKEGSDQNYANIIFNEDEKCPMLSQDGLCLLQMECGAAVLPDVCKTFPRNENKMFLVERSCTTGCEQVVRMLMKQRGGLRFKQVVETVPKGKEWDAAKAPEMQKRPILRFYHEIRLMCMGILQDRHFSLDNRMVLLGLALQELDRMEQEENLSDFPKWLQKYRALMENKETEEKLEAFTVDSRYSVVNNIRTLDRLQQINSGKLVHAALAEVLAQLKVSFRGKNHSTIIYKTELYDEHRAWLEEFLNGQDWLFENIIVNHLFYIHAPFQNDVGSIWEQYMLLCYNYSFFKFAAAAYMTPEKGQEDLVFILTACSRALLHGTKTTLDYILDQGRKNKDNTLSHMAVIVKG